MLLSLVVSQQTLFAQIRYIGEGGRLIFNILGISDKLNIYSYFISVNNEKAFDNLDYRFLLFFCNLALVLISLTKLKYY